MTRRRQRFWVVWLIVASLMLSPFSRVYCAVVTAIGPQAIAAQAAEGNHDKDCPHHTTGVGGQLAQQAQHNQHAGILKENAPTEQHRKNSHSDQCAACMALAAMLDASAAVDPFKLLALIPDPSSPFLILPTPGVLTGTLGSRGPPFTA